LLLSDEAFQTFGSRMWECVRKADCATLLLATSCVSVCPHRTTRLPPDGFSLNFIFGYSVKICLHIQILVNMEAYLWYYPALLIINNMVCPHSCAFVFLLRFHGFHTAFVKGMPFGACPGRMHLPVLTCASVVQLVTSADGELDGGI
jgi:hypothetical protein